MLEPLEINDAVEAEVMYPEHDFLLLIKSKREAVPAARWAADHKSLLNRAILRYGGVLLRGFEGDKHGFSDTAKALEPEAINYRGGVGPRVIVAPEVYTSTELPPKHSLAQHHEMAYNSYWPMHVLFFCQQPPEDGGATTICDARRFYRLLDPSLLDGFHRRGLRYVRNFTKEMPYKTIEETFGTTDRQQIREFCRQNHMQVEWHDDDRLSLVQDAPAVRYHPITGAPIFFNTLVLWHVSYWSKLLGAFRDNGAKVDETTLWGNSLYGDGTAIEDSVVATILGKYEEQERQILWQKGDIMYFDNMLASHGRMPFAGKRSILASFRTPTRAADLRATDGLRT